MNKCRRSIMRSVTVTALILVLAVSMFPFLAPSGASQVSAATGELTVPNIHINSTYSVGQSITFSWDRSSGVSDFDYYDVDISNRTYPFMDETWKMIQDINTNYYTFTPAHSGIYFIRISAVVENDNINRGKKAEAFIKVGDPLQIKNVSITADCCTISGTYNRQCNTDDSITIEPVSGEGRKFYPRSILYDYSDMRTWNELAICNFSQDISSYNVPDGQYRVIIKSSVDQFSTTYTRLITINHNWNSGIITTPQGCVTDGVRTYTCSKCEGTKTEVIPAIGSHSWDDGRITRMPTCAAEGAKTYTCDTCGETMTKAVAKTSSHTWDGGKVTKKATCVASGVRTYTCTTCDMTKTSSIPATGKHNWDSGKVTKAAKYFSTGTETFTCTDCGAKKTRTIPKKDVSKVKPAKVRLKSASVASRTLTVTWKRIAKNTKGYQVSLKNKNTGDVKNYKVRQSSKSVLSKKIKKLKKGKTYAVRIRAYNKIGGETIYGKWSKVLSGKVK